MDALDSKAFKESLNFFWQAQTSQIYRELNMMEKSGWLTSEIVFQTDKPNKKLYSITDGGRQELTAWLASEDIGETLTIRSEFLMKLFFSAEKSLGENISLLKAYKAMCERGLASLGETEGIIERYSGKINEENREKSLYWGLTAQFGKAYIQMCLEFANGAIKTSEELL